MVNFFKKLWGFNVKDVPFTARTPRYIPVGLKEVELQGEYQGNNKVLTGGCTGKDGSFIAIRQSDHELKEDKFDYPEVFNIRVRNVDIVIHRSGWTVNENEQPSEDKRGLYAIWQIGGVYFNANTDGIPLNEFVLVVTSMIG